MQRRTYLKHASYGFAGLGGFVDRLCGMEAPDVGASSESTTQDAADVETERFENQHFDSVVADAYSACVNLDDLQRGGVDVVIQALECEEILVRIPPNSVTEAPPLGMDIWENVFTGPNLVKRIRQGIDDQLKELQRNRDRIALARDGAEIDDIVASGRIALVMMLKSGWIDNDLANLRLYHRLGVRVMAPCHLAALDWADSSVERNRDPGLSDFGREVVAECARLGILVDLSHASDETFWDTLEVTTRPVIASHSNCRALTASRRDLTDEMLRAIAKTGGVAGIDAPTSRTPAEATQARLRRDRRLARKYADPFALAAAKRRDAIVWRTKLNLEHIDHAVEVAGIDHVGIASHCRSVPQWREFTESLIRHGYSAADARKILGENVLRVLKQAIDGKRPS